MKGLKIGGVPEHFNLPWRLSIEERLFDAIGLELHWSDMTGGTGQMIKGLQTGSIDIAVLLTEGITKSILEGLDAKIANIYVQTPLRWGVHVPFNSKFSSLSSLENGTFAISRFGSGSHLMSLVHANQAGWDTSKLKFNVVGDVYGGLWALENNEADGFLWEKYTTKPFVDQEKCRCIGEVITPWPCFVIAVRTEILEKYSELINHMSKIVGNQAKKLKENEQSTQTFAWRYHLDPEDVKLWLSETNWNYNMDFNKDSFYNIISIMNKLNLIDSRGLKNWKNELFV
ncbi:MAG: ABC transporter substrate-binding protein [Bacteroidetes bacterium]|nr:ABC transporter substrate-binding protein [Bacteroidota bacterium]